MVKPVLAGTSHALPQALGIRAWGSCIPADHLLQSLPVGVGPLGLCGPQQSRSHSISAGEEEVRLFLHGTSDLTLETSPFPWLPPHGPIPVIQSQ